MKVSKFNKDLFEEVAISRNFERLIGRRACFLKSLFLHLRDREDPVFISTGSSTIISKVYNIFSEEGNESFEFRGGSAGLNSARSINGAFGETMERYSLSIYNEGDIMYGSFYDLYRKGLNVFDPNKIKWFADDQYISEGFPFKKFKRDTKVGWCEGINMISKEKILFPAQYVHGYMPLNDEDRITYSTSSGCAAAETIEEAVLKSICEVIERDAVMMIWYAKITPPKLNIGQDDFLAPLYEDRFKKSKISYEFFDITTDIGIPSIMSIIINDSNLGWRCLMSAASSLSPRDATLRAMIEGGQSIPFINYLINRIRLSDCDPSNFVDFEHNVRYYAHPPNMKYFSFILSSSKIRDIEDIPNFSTGSVCNDLSFILSHLKERKFTVICYDLTTPEAESVGIHIVKTIIPELIPLNIPKYPFLGNLRLYMVPKERGYYDHYLDYTKFNKNPHPFP
jgi:ribosomal protein S12 methylthiotransferase accessory factor